MEELSDDNRQRLQALQPSSRARAAATSPTAATGRLLPAAAGPPASPSEAAFHPHDGPACVTTRMAQIVLAEYCARLPGTDQHNILQPQYLTQGGQGWFQTTLYLPSNSGISHPIQGPAAANKWVHA